MKQTTTTWKSDEEAGLLLIRRTRVKRGAISIKPNQGRQGPRFSIRMVIGIFCSDTETGAATPPGVMQKK